MQTLVMVGKIEHIGGRTSSEVKAALQKVAKREYRTLLQQCKKILIE